MAETPGKEAPDPRAVGKSGPVKPPVLEGTARPAGKAEDKPAAKPAKPEPPKTEAPKSAVPPIPPKPPTPSAPRSGGSPWLAGLLGGVVGLGAAYGLAYLGYWPSMPSTPPAADPRLAQFETAIPELQTVTGTVQDELSTLNGRVSGLETTLAELPEAPASAAPGEDYSDDIAALSARLEELAAVPAAQPAPPDNSAEIETLRTELAALSQAVNESRAAIEAAQGEIATLNQTADAEVASQGDAARLPLIFSGLESAFANGRAYEAELAALRAAQPDLAVPEAVAAGATTGLPQPGDMARQLDAVLPDMLAGRPVAADAGWQDATADWFRGVIAMRPAGEVEGTSPDAIVARLEAAVARRDFAAAQAEFEALPESMKAAAGSLGADLATLAAADSFIAELRTAALTPGAGA